MMLWENDLRKWYISLGIFNRFFRQANEEGKKEHDYCKFHWTLYDSDVFLFRVPLFLPSLARQSVLVSLVSIFLSGECPD